MSPRPKEADPERWIRAACSCLASRRLRVRGRVDGAESAPRAVVDENDERDEIDESEERVEREDVALAVESRRESKSVSM